MVKDAKTKVVAHEEYLYIRGVDHQAMIVGYVHIKALYLNRGVGITILQCYKISKKVPLFLIDHNGYICSRLIDA